MGCRSSKPARPAEISQTVFERVVLCSAVWVQGGFPFHIFEMYRAKNFIKKEPLPTKDKKSTTHAGTKNDRVLPGIFWVAQGVLDTILG